MIYQIEKELATYKKISFKKGINQRGQHYSLTPRSFNTLNFMNYYELVCPFELEIKDTTGTIVCLIS